jgi:hypothetical protein
MARLPINAYDNDRLKTRKVLQMLNELGVLPVDPSQRPTFLRDHRAAAILIDRALSRLAPQPLVERQCQNLRSLSAAVNEKFANAWPLPGGGGSGAPPAWARAGSIADIDFVNNPPRAWTSTGGEVAFANFDTIFGESSLIPDRAYNPAEVNLGVGYGDGDSHGSFIGAMIAAFNFDFSVVVEFDGQFNLEYVEDTFGTDIVFNYATTVSPRLSDQNSGFKVIDAGDVNGSLGAHKAAFTITGSSAYAAVDGVSLQDPDNPPATVIDPDTPNQPTDIVFLTANLKRLTVYNPIRTEADQRVLTG